MKLCVFDFDSTLMDGETIDMLAQASAQADKVSAITESAMRGELDFFEALTARVQLLKGLPYKKALSICEALPLMPGAHETIRHLKQKNYHVVIFSGGFREATRHHAKQLGADADFANFLHQKDGVLSGLVGGEMMSSNAKGELLIRLQRLLNISPQNTIAVGDGANDLSMFQHAGTKIAFRAKPILQQAADISIHEKNLTLILEHI